MMPKLKAFAACSRAIGFARAWVAGFWLLCTCLSIHAAGPEWWLRTSTDAAWTNKPLVEIQSAAERGAAVAQFYLARACFLGAGRARGVGESLQWTVRSATQGYADAQYMAAHFYYDAVGTPHDHDKGFHWASLAAKQGHAEAMTILGWAYTFEEGTAIDGRKAREWLERAEQSGSIAAQFNLGRYFLKGEGGLARRINYAEALHWFERAGSNGVMNAALAAADLCERGQGTPPDFPRALRWVLFAVDRGNLDAMERLAGYCATDRATPRSPDETPIRLYRRVAANLARRVLESPLEELNERTAPNLYGNCTQLWNRYRFGIGTPRDLIATAEWQWVAHQSRNMRNPTARTSGPLYRVITNASLTLSAEDRLWREAAILVDEALDQQSAEAWHRIGISYREGSELTPKQPFMAWAWLGRAAEMGHGPSRDALKELTGSLTAKELEMAKLHWVPPTRPL